MSRRKKLLFLSHMVPFPLTGGVFIRTYHILRLLARDYDIDLVAFDRRRAQGSGSIEDGRRGLGAFARLDVVSVPQYANRFRLFWDHLRSLVCQRVFTYYKHDVPAFLDRVQDLIASNDYAVVHVDSMDLVRALPLLGSLPVACTHHNVESELLRDRARATSNPFLRAHVLRQAALQEQVERKWCPRMAVNVTVSDRDAAALTRIAPAARVATIPNGVDVEAIAANDQRGTGIVCVGGLGWFPNRDALEFLCQTILPEVRASGLENVQVTWVGRASRDDQAYYLEHHGVKLTGFVDDVRPYVQGAGCYVMPFRLGGGTRLKLLEAWAAARPVVSTTTGAMGVTADSGKNILIADAPAEFAGSVVRVLRDEALATRLGREARATVVGRYAWNVIGESLRSLYAGIATDGSHRDEGSAGVPIGTDGDR